MINQELNLSKSNNIPSNKSDENESDSESFESKESVSSNKEDIRKISGDRILNNDVPVKKNIVQFKRRLSKKLSTNNENIDDKEIFIEEEELTCRQRLDRFLSYNNRLFHFKITVTIIAFLSFIFYIITTYKNKLCEIMNYIDFGVCSFFILEHIINAILSHHTFFYLISINSIINFVTEIPPFFSLMCSDYYLNGFYRLINATRVFRLIRVYRIVDLLQTGEKDAKIQIINIILTLFSVILIWAGVMQLSELTYVETNLKTTFDPLNKNNLNLRKDYHHYVYFIIASITTVGYGEIMPNTILGKFLIVLLVIVILVVIPEQTNELINLSNAQTIYERRAYKASNDIIHIVLMGEIDLDSLKSFCDEYFHRDHGNQYRHAEKKWNFF